MPKPAGWGEYYKGETLIYFFLGDFHDMDFSAAPDPDSLMSQIANLHRNGISPNGLFGFPIPTVCGKMVRTVTWEKSWAKSFTHQLKDVIKYDNETNGQWLEYDAACQQLINGVIPRLLGALQSDGREITPALIHGDFGKEMSELIWKQARLFYSILGALTPIMKWSLGHGDVPGPSTSTLPSTCGFISVTSNPRSR